MQYWLKTYTAGTYDVKQSFEKLGEVQWSQKNEGQNTTAKVGDRVLLWASKPVSAFTFEAEITEVNNENKEISDEEFQLPGYSHEYSGKWMKLTLIRELINPITHSEWVASGAKQKNPRSFAKIPANIVEFFMSGHELNDELETVYVEGHTKKVWSTKYERNKTLREKAIKIHGYDCEVCGFNFREKYGELGSSYIEVHHITPISKRGEAEVNPKKDLATVCANCHRMIHRSNPVISIDDMRKIISKNSVSRLAAIRLSSPFNKAPILRCSSNDGTATS
jgi:5-methylcytosine-specific restriction protein A